MGSMIYPIIILSILGVVYGVLRWRGINMFSFLNGGIMDLFKIAGMVGAVIEVLSLSELAIGRNVNPMTAYGRYTMLALVETLLGFWFISAMTESFYEKLKDGYITVYEVIKTLIGVSWIFYLSYFITGNIWITYLESQGRVELQQAYVSLINSISGIHIETDIEKFEFVDSNHAGIEYGAWGSIYISVLFNFLAMPYLVRKHWNQFRIVDPKGALGMKLYSIDFLYKNTPAYITPDQVKAAKTTAKNAPPRVNHSSNQQPNPTSKYYKTHANLGNSLLDYGDFLNSMFAININDLKEFTYEYCGRNFDTGVNVMGNATHTKVKDGSMTSDEALVKLTESLINKASYGLKELYTKVKVLSEEMIVVEKMRESMTNLEVEIDKVTDPSSRVTKIKEWESDHEKYKGFVSKIESLYSKYRSAHTPFISTLKSLNYAFKYDEKINPFEKDLNLLKAYVKTTKS